MKGTEFDRFTQRDTGILADPFPFDPENLHIEGMPILGRRLRRARTGPRFTIQAEGNEAAASRMGRPVYGKDLGGAGLFNVGTLDTRRRGSSVKQPPDDQHQPPYQRTVEKYH